jgi:hypothetical protein
MSKIRFFGLDVHADSIAVAVAEPSGEVRSLSIITNRSEADAQARSCRATARLLRSRTHRVCVVLAADRSCCPLRSGRTDSGTGDLTPVWVPDAAQPPLAQQHHEMGA